MKEEEIISEFRLIETEDGYRIEIKGDKEKLRCFGLPGAFPFGGAGMRFRGFGRRRRRRGPHQGPEPHGHRRGPRFWKRGRRWGWEEEADGDSYI